MIFEHKGKFFEITGHQVGHVWWCAICPCDSDGKQTGYPVIVAEPHATKMRGPLVNFESEEHAIDFGKKCVVQDFLRD